VSAYYDKFFADPLFIPNHLRHLFSLSPETTVKLSEDAIRCWISTIEEAEQTQLHTQHSMRGSRACLYKFLGKELPNTKPFSYGPPSYSVLSTTAPNQKRTKKQSRRYNCSFPQAMLSNYGFVKKTTQRPRLPLNERTNAPLKSDYSGTWVNTAP
jgi:hypothetical protein